MKKNNGLNRLIVLGVITLLFVPSVEAQQLQNLMNDANTATSAQYSGFKVLMQTIYYFFLGAAILVAAWAAFFQQDRMKLAISALIAGILLGVIGAAAGLIG